MSDFEAGMLVGVLAGVWAMVAFEKLLSHWLKVRVVAVDKKDGPCDPADQGDTLGADAVAAKPVPMILCPTCKGFKEVPFVPVGRLTYRGPKTIQCGCCKGEGVIKAPPKKP